MVCGVSCGDKPGDTDDDTTTTDPSTGTNPTMPTTGAPDSDSTAASEPTDSASGTGSDSDSDSGTTTDGIACTLDERVCLVADTNEMLTDCGVVTPDDPTPAWQAAHDCVIAAVDAGVGFKLITILQGIDSNVSQGYVGLVGEAYTVEVFFYDSDPCGGGMCGATVKHWSCESLTTTPDCMVELNSMCFDCGSQSETSEVCQA